MATFKKKKSLLWISVILAVLLWVGLRIYSTQHAGFQPLTKARVSAAQTLWKANGPKNYSMEVLISGAQSGHHSIVVENGKVVSMKTGGDPVAEHAWKYWSVDGMFEFLNEELLQAENPTAAFQTNDKAQVHLMAGFDPSLGYPVRYLRQVFGRQLTIEWEIKSFTQRL